MLTRALNRCGVFVGRADELMPGAGSNPEGHFEITRVARLNDDVLAAVGAHWAGPGTVEVDEIAKLASGVLGDDAAEVLRRELDGVAVVKDPRFCLTLPFWRAVLPVPPGLVVPWRHPDEVARSLEARNGLPGEYGRLIWRQYHRRLLEGGRGLRRLLVDHRRLLDQPALVVDEVMGFFGIAPIEVESVASPVRSELLHHHSAGPLTEEEETLLAALDDDAYVSPLDAKEQARRELLFGVAAPLGIAHDTVRAKLVGHPRREM